MRWKAMLVLPEPAAFDQGHPVVGRPHDAVLLFRIFAIISPNTYFLGSAASALSKLRGGQTGLAHRQFLRPFVEKGYPVAVVNKNGVSIGVLQTPSASSMSKPASP